MNDEARPVPMGVVREQLEAALGERENRLRCADCGHFQPVPEQSSPSEDFELDEEPSAPSCEACSSLRLQMLEQILYEHKLALDHAQRLTHCNATQANEIIEAVRGLEHVSDAYAVKIADLLPSHPNDVRTIFARERFTLSKEEIETIINAVRAATEG